MSRNNIEVNPNNITDFKRRYGEPRVLLAVEPQSTLSGSMDVVEEILEAAGRRIGIAVTRNISSDPQEVELQTSYIPPRVLETARTPGFGSIIKLNIAESIEGAHIVEIVAFTKPKP